MAEVIYFTLPEQELRNSYPKLLAWMSSSYPWYSNEYVRQLESIPSPAPGTGILTRIIEWYSPLDESEIEEEQMMKQQNTKVKSEHTESATHGTKYIGVDISLEHLDIYFEGKYKRLTNNQGGIGQIHKIIQQQEAPVIVAYESTGWLSRILAEKLFMYGIKQACLNPSRVRDYARGIGFKAKTDRIDCETIARFAEQTRVKCNVSENATQLKIKEYQSAFNYYKQRSIQSKTAIAAYKNNSFIREQIQNSIDQDERQMETIQEKMYNLIEAEEELRDRYMFYQSIPGIGPRTASLLVSSMPELGQMTRPQVASLAGAAPYNRDSGKMRGKRRTKFGRKDVKSALYLVVISSLRMKDNPIKETYYRLKERGKPSKVAIIACVRKLIIYLNTATRKWLELKERTGIIGGYDEIPWDVKSTTK